MRWSIYVILVPMSPRCHSTKSRFWVTEYFETSVPNDPKTTLSPTRSNVQYPIYWLLVSICSKFHSVYFYDQPFLRCWPFWKKCTEWPQNDFESYKVNVPHTCVIGIHESQISVHFALWPAVLEIQTILRQVHQMTPKWSWTLQGQNIPIICITSILESQISLRFTLWPTSFEIQAILR